MQLLSPPLRDLTNSRSAITEWMEELISIDRLRPLDRVQPRPWGFWLTLRGSPRFRSWWTERALGEHFLLWSAELDRFGSHLLLARPAKEEMYAGLCHWLDLPCAAAELREKVGEGRGWNTHETYSANIIAALQIPEGSLNSSPPNYCATRWGKWLRIDPANAERAVSYLLVDEPAPWDAPVSVSLGADTFAVVALSVSELRVGICSHLQDDLALKDAARWLKTIAPRRSKTNQETTPH